MDTSTAVRTRGGWALRRGMVAVFALVATIAAGCTTSSGTPITTAITGDTNTLATGPSSVDPPLATDPTTTTTSMPTTAATTSTSTTSTTTTTVAPTTTILVISEGGVVLVANASNVKGAATQLANRLAAVGYATAKSTNAAGYETSLDVSKVYFAPEAYPVAYSISKIMGIAVAPMPTPPPIQYATDGLRGANVIVMLGKDLAGKPIPGLPAG